MQSIAALYAGRREALLQALATQRDVSAAVDAARLYLDAVKQDYIAAEESALLRTAAVPLFAVGRESLGALWSARDTKVHIQLPTPVPVKVSVRSVNLVQEIRKYLPLILSVLTAVALLARGNLLLTILGVAAAAASLWQTAALLRSRDKPPVLPTAEAEILVDAQQLSGTLENLCVVMDRILLEQAENQRAQVDRPTWTPGQLISVQMLWEALQTGDGAYALKAVPGLLDALEGQAMEIVLYSPEMARYFETVPAETGGRTIRPALVSGDTLLARGQVTVPMR